MQGIFLSSRRLAVVATLLLWCVAPAAAQSVKLAFHNGRVDISAENAPLRTVLEEWSRIGGTKIVNLERVGSAPITMQMTNVPERSVLEVLLRSVAGYIAGARAATGQGASMLASILIVPTSTPGPATVVNRPAGFAAPQPQPSLQTDPGDPDDNPNDPAPAGPRQRPPFGRPIPNGVVPGPNGQPLPRQPDPEDQPPPPDRPATTPSNPFGIQPGVGSATPGVISPAPQPQQRPQRPSGDPEP